MECIPIVIMMIHDVYLSNDSGPSTDGHFFVTSKLGGNHFSTHPMTSYETPGPSGGHQYLWPPAAGLCRWITYGSPPKRWACPMCGQQSVPGTSIWVGAFGSITGLVPDNCPSFSICFFGYRISGQTHYTHYTHYTISHNHRMRYNGE